jgi:uncharacterized protein YcfJ
MRKTLYTLGLSSLLVSFSVQAEQNFIDYGRVLQAEPVYKTIYINQPHQECWTQYNKHDRHNRQYPRHNDRHSSEHRGAGGAIAGALVGGVIGNNIGRGHNRKLAAITGSVIGAAIGSGYNNNNIRHNHPSKQSHNRHHKSRQQCRNTSTRHAQQKLQGYDVSYSYRGEVYNTFTSRHPGRRIRLSINISPFNE